MVESIFHNGAYKELENKLLDCLQSFDFAMSDYAISSTRGAGDTIENIISQKFPELIAKTSIQCTNYSADFARRAMADLAFTATNNYYVVDVKSHRIDTAFNMPNLTSVERLSRFYEDNNNYFVIFLIAYSVLGNALHIAKVSVFPIEFLSWECLTLGALGWGQIQIANSNRVQIVPCSRKQWMLQLCEILINTFYPREIGKITKRKNHFEKLYQFWQSREDVWA